jgi:hypothetical protein
MQNVHTMPIETPIPLTDPKQWEDATITVRITVRRRWVPQLLGLLKHMQMLGSQGSSRWLHFFSDGDGDFRPVVEVERPTSFLQFSWTSHCASTLMGLQGTDELLDFGRSIGLRVSWLQHRGAPREHFDLFDHRIVAARAHGAAEITPREFIRRVVWPKREQAGDLE